MTAEQFGEKEGTWGGDDWALWWSKAGGQRKPSGASERDSLSAAQAGNGGRVGGVEAWKKNLQLKS